MADVMEDKDINCISSERKRQTSSTSELSGDANKLLLSRGTVLAKLKPDAPLGLPPLQH